VTQRLLVLFGSTAALWLLTGVPASRLGGGEDALRYSGTAALLCVLPMAVALAVTARLAARNSPMLTFAVLGATGLRMFVVLAAAVALATFVSFYRETAFWLWLAIFYAGTLVLEVSLLLVGRPAGPPR
jgi:hypothetical protein